MACYLGSSGVMIESVADVTALVTAIGILVAAIGAAAMKIGKCLDQLRQQTLKVQQQTVRMRSETAMAGLEISDQSEKIKGDIAALRQSVENVGSTLLDRATVTDRHFERVHNRIDRLESKL